MKKTYFIFFLIMFLIGTDTFLISPLLPTLTSEFHIHKDISGWLMGAYALGYVLFALVAGPISDTRDRKRVVIVGMFMFSISTFLCGTASGFWPMFTFRFLAGVSAAFTAPQVWAAISIIVPSEKVVKIMGFTTAGLAISQALGVPAGITFSVISWNAPFIIIGVLSMVLTLFIMMYFPSLPAKSIGQQLSLVKKYGILFSGKRAVHNFIAYFIFQTGVFATFTFLGTWMADHFHLKGGSIGSIMIVIGLGNICGSLLTGMVVKRWGIYNVLIIGIIISALIYLGVPESNIYGVHIEFFILYILAGIIFPVMMTVITSLSPSIRGTISSLASATMYAATTLGSALAGFLYVHAGGFVSISCLTAITSFSSLIFFIAGKEQKGTSPVRSFS